MLSIQIDTYCLELIEITLSETTSNCPSLQTIVFGVVGILDTLEYMQTESQLFFIDFYLRK